MASRPKIGNAHTDSPSFTARYNVLRRRRRGNDPAAGGEEESDNTRERLC